MRVDEIGSVLGPLPKMNWQFVDGKERERWLDHLALALALVDVA